METLDLAPIVAYAREIKMECRECHDVRPLFEWAREKAFVAPMPAPRQLVRREDETLASAGHSNLICRMCNQANWAPAHPMKDVLMLVLLLPEEALSQIFAKVAEKRISDRCATAA